MMHRAALPSRTASMLLQYKLTLSEDLQLEPTGTSRTRRQAAADADSAAAARRGQFSRLSSWGPEAAAEAAEAVAAVAAQRRRWQQQQQEEQQLREGEGRPQTRLDQLGVDCFADLHYQARVKGFMQPRRMRVLLPHPSLLFYDQQLPHLSRRCSESDAMAAAIAGMSVTGRSETGASTAASSCASPEASPQPAAVVGLSSATAGTHAVEETAVGFVGPCRASSGRLARLLSSSRPRRGQLLRQQKTVPADEGLQPVVLQNKAPHWNEGLRCWCLNFRGRVKLASVKNFQVRHWACCSATPLKVSLQLMQHAPQAKAFAKLAAHISARCVCPLLHLIHPACCTC